MPKNAKRELYQYIDKLREACGFSFSEVFNVKKFCSSLGGVEVICHHFDTPGFCGAAFEGDINTIVLNEERSEKEQNFDCGHEFVHLTRHRGQSDGFFQCFSTEQNSFLEWEANEGAAQLIVPYQDFIPRFAWSLNEYPLTYAIPDILADHYNVTPRVINIRLDSLGYEIDQYRKGVEIDQIRLLSRSQCKRESIVPTSYSAYCAFSDMLDDYGFAI